MEDAESMELDPSTPRSTSSTDSRFVTPDTAFRLSYEDASGPPPTGNRFRASGFRICEPSSPVIRPRRPRKGKPKPEEPSNSTQSAIMMDTSEITTPYSPLRARCPINRDDAPSPPRLELPEASHSSLTSDESSRSPIHEPTVLDRWTFLGSAGDIYYYNPLVETSDSTTPFGPSTPLLPPIPRNHSPEQADTEEDLFEKIVDVTVDFAALYARLLHDQGEVEKYAIPLNPYSAFALFFPNIPAGLKLEELTYWRLEDQVARHFLDEHGMVQDSAAGTWSFLPGRRPDLTEEAEAKLVADG